jgi:RimJ/RimL family protein N-acetyltransferase
MRLREVADSDLDVLFAQQADPDAYLLADVPTRDRTAFYAHWLKIRSDPESTIRTIDIDGEFAGHVLSFTRDGEREVGYWIGREFWGRGIASGALADFLAVETRRPLHANVARDNPGSIRVLEKNGFRRLREEPGGFAFVLD